MRERTQKLPSLRPFNNHWDSNKVYKLVSTLLCNIVQLSVWRLTMQPPACHYPCIISTSLWPYSWRKNEWGNTYPEYIRQSRPVSHDALRTSQKREITSEYNWKRKSGCLSDRAYTVHVTVLTTCASSRVMQQRQSSILVFMFFCGDLSGGLYEMQALALL